MRIHTIHTRDAALQQLQRLNRWLIAGSVLLTGAFTEAAAHAFPGRTVKKTAATGVRTKGRAHSGGASRQSTTSTGSAAPLKPPAQAPQAVETNSSSESAPQAHEAAPSQEAQATQEPAPEHEAAPAQEVPHTEASSPPAEAPHESAPEPQPEPEPEPVVSGGS